MKKLMKTFHSREDLGYRKSVAHNQHNKNTLEKEPRVHMARNQSWAKIRISKRQERHHDPSKLMDEWYEHLFHPLSCLLPVQ